ncbi:hypothetical protein HMPREF9144_0838 [Prevotella pallens ATCC 700821]|uniref:Uncharacterized protein n=1 Tax=Prevotella pallens ATCC 700821 TaxID=997353 RepID=F9DGP8_9BACT|nr:hypothetical protein HMPREF9144_0838 [Prevotella pallens ATCC 700821]
MDTFLLCLIDNYKQMNNLYYNNRRYFRKKVDSLKKEYIEYAL